MCVCVWGGGAERWFVVQISSISLQKFHGFARGGEGAGEGVLRPQTQLYFYIGRSILSNLIPK